jgi:hypothetical protein
MKPSSRIVALAFLLSALPVSAAVRFDWHDTFTPEEQTKLTQWVTSTVAGVESLVGPYPFDVHVNMYRIDGAREPVPWANTRRGSRQGVNFHVDPSFDLDAFQRDWTAPHELSHLILPYLGRKHSWFAEGFASYMQYQVMMATNQLSASDANARYLTRLDRARRDYRYNDAPFVSAAPKLRQERKYPVMYWGGAAYFLQIEDALAASSDTSLIAVLRDYFQCCRANRKSFNKLISDLDRLSGSSLFSQRLDTFRTRPGFPEYDMLQSE